MKRLLVALALLPGLLSTGGCVSDDSPAASGRYATHDRGNNYFGGYGRWAP